ncbi:zinc ribbon-containing protein [Alkalimonas amylolytica]|uniref:Zinc-ribbon containing domain-containing protein n=1 Tax=Alkalimonas amylolytica TaxID=152573 RepID=A0A1H4CPZ6_ALKAM|nr:hypothetical protein [Alkalimonas amylolytica]SEA62172.1 Zinc-ribbon containing domain-containing protein [Alkalimonas amylolytica]
MELKKKYQAWLTQLADMVSSAEKESVDQLMELNKQIRAYFQAGKDLTAHETRLFVETLKRQWQDTDAEADEQPSLWPEALWYELAQITDRSQVEWQEILEDFRHKGVYFQGERVGMGCYRCDNCGERHNYYHPSELLACTNCGGVSFNREGVPLD